jgi:two-component system phosphate regulon response regulator PhoB
MADILIVDDDPANRKILSHELRKEHHMVREAANGEEGLKAVGEAPPHLIILDAMMPKVDGWQVCRRLKGDERTKSIPIVMLTGCDQRSGELRGWESGADDYLVKPWTPAQLWESVRRLLPYGDAERS